VAKAVKNLLSGHFVVSAEVMDRNIQKCDNGVAIELLFLE
jgi:hypothetical protein